MITNKLELVLTSYLDSDTPSMVAELWCPNGMFAVVRLQEETAGAWLEVYPIAGDSRPIFDVRELQDILSLAERRLVEIQGN